MEDYQLLHARNELAHNNRMILQASGTLCLLVTFTEKAVLEDFLSFMKLIETKNNLTFAIHLLNEISSEAIHHYLLNTKPESISLLLLCFENDSALNSIDLFIGQEFNFRLGDDSLSSLSDENLKFQLPSNEGQENWEAWLLDNLASHEVEYYEPGMD